MLVFVCITGILLHSFRGTFSICMMNFQYVFEEYVLKKECFFFIFGWKTCVSKTCYWKEFKRDGYFFYEKKLHFSGTTGQSLMKFIHNLLNKLYSYKVDTIEDFLWNFSTTYLRHWKIWQKYVIYFRYWKLLITKFSF